MSEESPAKKYVAIHGKAVEDWFARYIEGLFGRVEVGAPRYMSEFGIPYDEHLCDLDASEPRESMMAALKLMTTQSMPPDPKSCTLVWRTLPQVYDRAGGWSRGRRSWPNIVRVRYRCHTIEGTTDVALNELKAACAATAWDQPSHGD
jgi:hypothetical protein